MSFISSLLRAPGMRSVLAGGLLLAAGLVLERLGARHTWVVPLEDRIRVRPGESIPTDGVVEEGGSAVDESSLTGESIPVEKKPGDRLFAGTLNRSGSLVFRATATAEENSVSRLVKLVEVAQKSKGRSQQVVERFTNVYSPLILGTAALLLVLPLAIGGSFSVWARYAVVLLVAAAPCALAMSTPVAFAAGMSAAGRHGILIKGGRYLEVLGRIRTVAFDKTGTLTRGRPELVVTEPVAGTTEQELLATAASLERLSEHPLAAAVLRAAETNGVTDVRTASEFRALPGSGVEGVVDGERVRILQPDGRDTSFAGLDRRMEELARSGITPAIVLARGRPLGILGFRDEPRPEAPAALCRLREAGINRLVVLSGDRPLVAQNIVFSVVVLAILIPVALTGLISITMTVVAHETAELMAVANGLRALRGGRDHTASAGAT